ncbi:MAG: hypothetical protein ACOYI4_06145 [Christensenellales bacterium]
MKEIGRADCWAGRCSNVAGQQAWDVADDDSAKLAMNGEKQTAYWDFRL